MTGTSENPIPNPQEAERVYHDALSQYEIAVGESGIVQATLLGFRKGLRTNYMWHVLSADFTGKSESERQKFDKLSENTAKLLEQVGDYRPLRIATIHASQLPDLQRRYEDVGFKLHLQTFKDTTEPSSINSVDPLFVDTPDLLLGGLVHVDGKLETMRMHAAHAREVLRVDESGKLGLDLGFDSIKDKKAARLLEDITLARNETSGYRGFAKGLELPAEPSRVFQELSINVFRTAVIDDITVLDITGAIESGALKPYFETQPLTEEEFKEWVADIQEFAATHGQTEELNEDSADIIRESRRQRTDSL